MKNRKGFTLVELLAVVVLLSILLVMAIPAVLSFTSRMKQDMFCNKVETVVKSAQLYGQDNMSSIVNKKVGKSSTDSCVVNGTQRLDSDAGIQCVKVKVSVLLAKGYLSKEAPSKNATPNDFFDPRDGSSMKDNYVFAYIKNKRAYAAYIFNNQKDANLCKGSYYANGTNNISTV
jgi:prepilin-type N-terminal cleavage/methylation domain-containing protein